MHQAIQVWLQGCWIYGNMESGDLPAVLTFGPACGWRGDSLGACEARAALLLLLTAFLWLTKWS